MSWKLAEFQQFNTDRITRGDGYSPTLAVAFRLPDAALDDLNADVAEESDGPMRAAVEKWRNESGHYGRHAQLTGEFARTTKRRDDAQAKSASLQAAVDQALFDGRQPDQLEKQHDAATRELKAAEYRLQRLSVLIPEAKRAALESCGRPSPRSGRSRRPGCRPTWRRRPRIWRRRRRARLAPCS